MISPEPLLLASAFVGGIVMDVETAAIDAFYTTLLEARFSGCSFIFSQSDLLEITEFVERKVSHHKNPRFVQSFEHGICKCFCTIGGN